MLGPFHALTPPFTPWCQVHFLLIHPKKDSHLRRVIIDLFWPHPMAISVNGFTSRESYLSKLKKMHLLSVSDLMDNIMGAGHDCYLYSCDISWAYREIPLNPINWPLLFLKVSLT